MSDYDESRRENTYDNDDVDVDVDVDKLIQKAKRWAVVAKLE